ncbi:MAG: prepilin peptidase, partial [Bacilli bacterium]|nr:prepilin peptidase [Bacilli bacterium]
MEIIIIILGLVLGSFYNVVGLRIPNGESIIKPGSHCPKCNHKLSWYENIPVLSYIFLGG